MYLKIQFAENVSYYIENVCEITCILILRNNRPLRSLQITIETLIFRIKNTNEETENFIVETHSINRGSYAIEVTFCFISISQSVAEI